MTVVASPVAGRVVTLDEVDDPTFSERVMGDGVALRPSDGAVVAPVAGSIAKLFPGGHGIAIAAEGGLELLVHVGLETVRLEGDGFEVVAAQGDDVAVGDVLVRVDLERLAELGVDAVTPVVVISDHEVHAHADGEVAAGDPIFEVVAPAT